MPSIRIHSLSVENYRSFGAEQNVQFPDQAYQKPVAIVGYNNAGKTNLMNAIRFGLCESVREDTFEMKDFHGNRWNNPPAISLVFEADIQDEHIKQGYKYNNTVSVKSEEGRVLSVQDVCNCYRNGGYSKKWIIKQKAPIFYINFHNIKEEISTQKTSWGNLKSFLAKHIRKIVDLDKVLLQKRSEFEEAVKAATNEVLNGTSLQDFIDTIQANYSHNLRDNACAIEFGLPNYSDIFLKMLFKIGLDGKKDNLIPLDHFGDGFISMFVMAVIQSIAETNIEDKCLFLFEEPESFLHENHQEYFYKVVLCGLAAKGHQVIYTTHSDKMVDPFDTAGIIRLEMDEHCQTVVRYNDVQIFVSQELDEDTGEVINMGRYNEFIRAVEPNLNRILFGKKVILVEGPNDVLVYKQAIYKKVLELIKDNPDIKQKEIYASAFLNFENISLVCHHGKATALYLIEVCKHFRLDYFVITDWDLNDFLVGPEYLDDFIDEQGYKDDIVYKLSDCKAMMTTNFKLIKAAGLGRIHFNDLKLETVIGYNANDKDTLKIWNLITSEQFQVTQQLFPIKLSTFISVPVKAGEIVDHL